MLRRSLRKQRLLNFSNNPNQNSHTPKVSVVIPVKNERKTISRVIQQVAKVHPLTEVIVVSNGSNDGTKTIAMRKGAKVVSYNESLGHDVGRSIGAREARGDIILFLDGDFVIPYRKLIPYVKAIENGLDVALNAYSGPVNKKYVHHVVLSKHVLNTILSRKDLKGASLTTVPHAMSRKAMEGIGVDNLSVPPKALAIAVKEGLKIGLIPPPIYVGRLNRKRVQRRDPIGRLIVGDHLEAIHWWIAHTNYRGNKTDLGRKRNQVR